MDILDANFSKLLPPTISQFREQQNLQRRSVSPDDGDKYLQIVNTDSNIDTTRCGKGLMREILSNLETIELFTLYNHSVNDNDVKVVEGVDFDELRRRLSQIDYKLERLSFHTAFCNREARNDFFDRIETCLDLTDACIQIWESLESAFVAVEKERAAKKFILPPDTPLRMDALQWHSWCNSKGNFPTEEILTKAEWEGIDIPARVHYLPFGGFTILEHWRKDVNDVIGSLLQVNDSDVIKEQIAKLENSYFALVKDESVKKTKLVMNPVEIKHGGKLRNTNALLAPLQLSYNAHFLEKLDGMAVRLRGPRHFGLVLRTFLDVPGMRAAEKRRLVAILNSGRYL